MYLRELIQLEDHDAIVADGDMIQRMRDGLTEGDVFIIKHAVDKDLIAKIRTYLTAIGRQSLPNYCPIEPNCPNFHRVNRWDSRAYVQGCFHQFAFFPWNQDVFGFFERFDSIYQLKNLIAGLPARSFLGEEPEDGCIARLAFQFYPRGLGAMHLHEDPVNYHQLSIPILVMSEKGTDFQEGGAFVEREDGSRIILDDLAEPGDVVHFNAQIRHGVERIDPLATPDWLSFEGRWMLLFAVNKLFDNARIQDAVDLEISSTMSGEMATG